MLEAIREYVRPLQGAVMLAVLLIGAVISGVLEMVRPGMGTQFTVGVAGWFIAIPSEFYALLGGLAGAYTVTRGVEKVASIKASGQAAQEASEDQDAGIRTP